MLDRSTSPNAVRSRRKRARRRLGERVYRIPTCEADVIEALIRSRRLSEAETRRADLIDAALGEVVGDWAKRWMLK
jgi:hypothetical protein